MTTDYYRKIIDGKEYKKLKNYNNYKKMLERLKSDEPLNKLMNVLEVEDSVSIETGYSIKIELNKLLSSTIKYKLNNKYIYNMDIPLFKREEDGIVIYKFIHSGYPNLVYNEDCDLNITRFLADELLEDTVKAIVVYDFKSWKRYEIGTKKGTYFSDVFKILKTIDSDLVPRYSCYDNCIKCENMDLCDELSLIANSKGEEYVI